MRRYLSILPNSQGLSLMRFFHFKIAFCVFIILSCFSSVLTQSADSRNMYIPRSDEEMNKALNDMIQTQKQPQIRLHYRVGVYEKFTSILYTYSSVNNKDSSMGYMGIEPVSFSKPSASIYKQSVGFWGRNLKTAVKDNARAHKIMKGYQTRSIISSTLLTMGATAAFLTASGLSSDSPVFSNNMQGHLTIGAGATIGLLTLSIIPKLFNRGLIQKAVAIYNK